MTVVSSAPARRAAPSDGYTARHLTVLEGLEAVRKRPGMYIGSTDGRGMAHCLWEIIDNAVDEALGGHGDEIDVVLHPDGSAEVHDHGRGIPVDIEPSIRAERRRAGMTRLHAGGKFGGGSYTRVRRPARRRRLGSTPGRPDGRGRGPERARVGGQLPPWVPGEFAFPTARTRRSSPGPACARSAAWPSR